METIYLGVDIAKADLEAAMQIGQETVELGAFANNAGGFQSLQEQLSTYQKSDVQIHLIVEPTGSYHLSLVSFAHKQGWQVSLPNPKVVRDWAKGQGRRAKTDKIDAQTLAHYGTQVQPTAQTELPEEVVILDALLHRQEDLEQMLRQERNRLHSLQHHPTGVKWVTQQVESTIAFLEQELDAVQAAIRDHLKRHRDLNQKRKHLLTIPGIGAKNVLYILILLYKWDAHTAGTGTAKGLTAYVGLDPVVHQSGSSVRRRTAISKMGDSNLRRRLFLCALGGQNAKGGPLVAFYQGLLSRNKPKMVALIASARKILVWSWAIFRSDRPFDPALAMPA